MSVMFRCCCVHTAKLQMQFMKSMDIVCVHNVVCGVCNVVLILGY
jgi:hypothetical protein